jgi:hypothetical protein
MKSARLSGVSCLRIRGLRAKFEPTEPYPVIQATQSEQLLKKIDVIRSTGGNPWTEVKLEPQKLQPEQIGPTISESEVDLTEPGQATLSQDEARLRMDQLEELMLTDPALYEQLIANGTLEDEEKNSDAIDG